MDLDRVGQRYGVRPSAFLCLEDADLARGVDLACARAGREAEADALRAATRGRPPEVVLSFRGA